MSERKFLWWHEMALPELTSFAKEVSDIAILPIGAIEQHGPHSPNGVDLFNARFMAQEIAKKTDVMLLPPLPYGSHPYHHWYMPGTIPLSYDTHTAVLVDIIKARVSSCASIESGTCTAIWSPSKSALNAVHTNGCS